MGPDVDIFKSPPGDANMQPELRTSGLERVGAKQIKKTLYETLIAVINGISKKCILGGVHISSS